VTSEIVLFGLAKTKDYFYAHDFFNMVLEVLTNAVIQEKGNAII
jgi:hypothetical protein